jgi:hypothetical protein
VGDVNVTLFIASSAADTDFMVKLLDVATDGRAYNLADTAVRTRYRNGYQAPALLQPGKVYPVTLTGTGGRNFDESTPKVARNRVVHGPAHASFVEFTTQSP